MLEERRDGATTFGTTNQPQSGVRVNTMLGTISYLSMLDTAGVEYFLWFDTSGKLRTATAIPANPNTGGTVVGSQT